jgi:hypothetical protein
MQVAKVAALVDRVKREAVERDRGKVPLAETQGAPNPAPHAASDGSKSSGSGRASSDRFTTNVFGRDVSIPVSDIRRSPEAWAAGVHRDAGVRKGVVDQIKEALPENLHTEVENLFTTWLSPGVKKDSAYYALETLVNDPRVPEAVKGKILDLWSSARELQDNSHWN